MEGKTEAQGLVKLVAGIDWSKKSALGTGTVANFLIIGFLATFFSNIGVKLEPRAYLAGLCVLETVIGTAWVYNRYLRPYDFKTMSVGFAVKTDKGSDELYATLKRSFESYLNEAGMTDIVRLRRLPSDLFPKTDKRAEKYVNDKGLRVLIWGDATTGKVSSDDVSIFKIRVSYQHAPMDELSHLTLAANIGNGVRRGIWAIRHKDSLADTLVVSNNLAEISVYAFALCLISVRQPSSVLNGIRLLEILDIQLNSKVQDTNFPNLNEVKTQIRELLAAQYQAISVYYFFEKHLPQTALEWSQKTLALRPSNYFANINAARFSWELGNRQAAFSYTHKAASLEPRRSLHKLNLAFFYLYGGNYGKALQNYRQLNSSIYDTSIPEV